MSQNPQVIVPPSTAPAIAGPDLTYPELTLDDLLDGLIEECAEIIQAASKCKRFGFYRAYRSYGRNDEQLMTELGDLAGIVERLPIDRNTMRIAAAEKIRNMQNHKKALLYEQALEKGAHP